MIEIETLKKLEKEGLIESVDYYYDVYDNIQPLLDYLTYDVIKSISERIQKTKEIWDKENKPPCLTMGWYGNEYILAVNSYLAKVKNKKSTAYTTK